MDLHLIIRYYQLTQLMSDKTCNRNIIYCEKQLKQIPINGSEEQGKKKRNTVW